MGLTRTQRQRTLTAAPAQDRSRILWSDPQTGWSLHELMTLGDYWREGHLMANCLRLDLYEDPRVWPLPRRATMSDFPVDIQDPGFVLEARMSEPLEKGRFISLRDDLGYPHANFELETGYEWTRPSGVAGHNNDLVNPQWLQLIDRACVDLGWRPLEDTEHARAQQKRMAHARTRKRPCGVCEHETTLRGGASECSRCSLVVCPACTSASSICQPCSQPNEPRTWWPGLSRDEAA